MPLNTFDHFFIERKPAFDFITYDPENIDAYLKNPYFNNALKIASPSLWKELDRKKKASIPLENKELFSLRKYINRIHFRATPFAFFSIVSAGKWGEGVSHANSSEKFLTARVHYKGPVLNSVLVPVVSTNASYYKVKNDFRYLYFENTDDGDLRWRIDTLPYSSAVKAILVYCNTPRSESLILSFISVKNQTDFQEARQILQSLIDCQLLYTNEQASSLGKWSNFKKINITLHQTHELQIFNADIQTELSFVNLYDEQKDELEKSCKKNIIDGITCLGALTGKFENPSMRRFTDQFQIRYDRQIVPLTSVLDPEIGIGYGSNRPDDIRHNTILEDLPLPKESETAPRHSIWTDVHSLLLKKIQKGGPAIEIQSEDIDLLQMDKNLSDTPSMAVLFRLDKERRVILESAGGTSALGLISRFSDNDDIAEITRRIAGHESLRNPDVIFAEINCRMPGKHYNLHRRTKTYSHEICIGFSGIRPEDISINELHLFMDSGEIILYCPRLKSRIIPRLSSAYNYRHNNLPVFKFLCDLQFEGIKHNYGFQLKNIFPDLTFFPRITYKETIIELACWKLDKRVVNSFKQKDKPVCLTMLRQLISDLSIPAHVRILEFDTYLVFDLSKGAEMLFFVDFLQTMDKEVILQEYPFLEQNGNPKAHSQFVALIQNENASYAGTTPPPERPRSLPDKTDPLNWHFLKIYCHPNRIHELLTKHIQPAAKKLVTAGTIKKWFYIIYNDPEPHIRLRLNLKDQLSMISLMNGLKNLYSLQNHGLIKEIVQAPYQPEYERYGITQIGSAEALFFYDSEFCTSILKITDQYKPEYFYWLAYSVHQILEQNNWDQQKKIDFMHRLSFGGFQEFRDTPKLQHEINQSYRSHAGAFKYFMTKSTDRSKINLAGKPFYRQLGVYLKNPPKKHMDDIIADIIHMHLNRLFNASSRFQEAILYHWLYKYYLSDSYINAN
jgi:thiopeptide-type bacteriocin biosynthesis protein